MALAAAQVVDAVAARIKGVGVTDSGERVYTSRAWPLKDLPAWRVVAEEEDIEALTMHTPALLQHVLRVAVQGNAEAVSDLDDNLNGLASQALSAIFSLTPPADALAALGGKVKSFVPVAIARDFAGEGQARLGQVKVTLQATFQTMSNAPDVLV
ncbi:MAG: hypothetical protein ABI605_10885 [Rhizobacter sp.]